MKEFFSLLFATLLTAPLVQAEQDHIVYEGKAGPGKGKHLVFLTGDEEYRGEEGLPMLAKILKNDPANYAAMAPYWWSVIFGANLGGNITPIGSASTVVAMTIIHKHKLPLTFVGFVKIAALFALVQIIIAVVYVVVLSLSGILVV